MSSSSQNNTNLTTTATSRRLVSGVVRVALVRVIVEARLTPTSSIRAAVSLIVAIVGIALIGVIVVSGLVHLCVSVFTDNLSLILLLLLASQVKEHNECNLI